MSIEGVPGWVVWAFLGVFVLEAVLGRSKNPRVRSTLGAFSTALLAVVAFMRVARVPGIGPGLVMLLQIVAPPPPQDKGMALVPSEEPEPKRAAGGQ